MKISLYPPLAIHEIGGRNNQEDALIHWNSRLFVLCDGMGGHEKGEVASQTVSQSLVIWFEQNKQSDETFTDDELREALEYAYRQLDKYADGNPKQMGTTLTLLYLHSHGVTAAHIGDSRIYHIRPGVGTLYQSRDHSLVFDLYQSGEITYEEMLNFTQKNVITRAMTPGEDNRHRPDIIHITDIHPGDYFYMCSDGMLEQMSNNELIALLSSDMSDDKKRHQLIASTSNNQDNHSAWIIHVKDVAKEKGDEQLINEEHTSRCNTLNIVPQAKSIDDSDDVVVVSTPHTFTPKWRKIIKYVIDVLVLILILFLVWAVFVKDKKKPENKDKKPQKVEVYNKYHHKK